MYIIGFGGGVYEGGNYCDVVFISLALEGEYSYYCMAVCPLGEMAVDGRDVFLLVSSVLCMAA